MSLNQGYCPACGARIQAYPQKVIDVINRTLAGETVTIVSSIDDCSFQRRAAIKRQDICLGPDARFLRDAIEDKVLDHKYDWDEEEVVVDGYRHQLNVKITDYISIRPDFRKSRSDFDRVELAASIDIDPYFYEEKPKCPLCGGTTVKWTYFFPTEFVIPEKEKCRSDAEQYVSGIKQECIPPKTTSGLNTAEIKKYLDTLIGIEAEIYYFTNRLESLFIAQKDTGRHALRERCSALQRARETVELQLQAAKTEKAGLDKKYPLLPLTVAPDEFGLCEPAAPILKKAGIFNKKKIEEENRQATEQYERELSDYRTAWRKIQQDELTRRTAENAVISENRNKAESQLDACIDALAQQAASVTVDITNSGFQMADQFCLAEIEEVKEKIRSLCDVRAQLIGLGVIYPKYLDFIALTTIAEYFDTGRCSELEGPNGAYNMYESEIRANRVIAQLDQVIASLETIKQNQYRAYSVLSQISRDTASISDKMTSAVKSLSEISQNTAAIKETGEQIAYNTAKTAYYSKVNAELTDALGYVMAFK